MSQVINTNIMSLTAQRNLNNTNSALATAMQRLSSGLRINSAKDDAAGLAISTRFTTQINGLNTAVRNANDGISLAQTTESALGELTNNLQAIRQLAVQAANATNSDSDRAALNAEVQQRLAEVTRISQQTTFNGRHVLDGSFGTAAFQIGANVGETIAIDLSKGTKASQIGEMATSATGNISALFASPAGLNLAAGDLTVQSGTGTAVDVAAGNYQTLGALATAIQTAAGAGVTVAVSGGGTGTELTVTNTTANALTFGGNKVGSLGLTTVAASTPGATTPGSANSTTGLGAAISGAFNAITLASGDFTVQVGTGTTFSVTGTFKDASELAGLINNDANINGTVTASVGTGVDAGKLILANGSGTDALTIGGTVATTDLGIATSVAASSSETSTSTVAADVAANANVYELSAGELTINGGAGLTGTFTDAASLKALIDGATISGLTTTVGTDELDFTNSSGTNITFGGAMATTLGLPTTVAAAVTGAATAGTGNTTGATTAVTAAAGTALTLATGDLTINGIDLAGTYEGARDLVDAINGQGIAGGVAAYYDSTTKSVHLNSQAALTVAGTKSGAGAWNLNFSGAGAAIALSGSLEGATVTSVASANDVISRIDSALTTVSGVRSDLGAIQNRFDSTISNLQAISENLSASRSRIQDADFAAETANMSRAQILQQAGVSMLAQANAAPQMVLKLLQ